MKPITLIALDLDGTLFNSKSIISKENLQTIRCAVDSGVTVVISTGRPYSGLPLEQLKGTGIQYAITTNGSAIYEIDSRRCVCEECIPNEISFPIIEFLLTKDMHFDAFIQGNAYSPNKCLEAARQLQIPDSLKKYIIDSRIRVDDILAYINLNIGQPITVEQLAEHFFLSESYICRIFKQATGTTVGKYITARRISIAKAHLNEGASVNEAFEKSGFGDYSNFFKAFTKAVGVSPKKYANLSVS